jgi:methylglutaconyl-CoA hydratase
MTEAPAVIRIDRDDRGVATITLNRPEVRNAINPQMIGEITDAFLAASADDAIRAVVVQGAGKVFCAGGDLNWMRDVEGYTEDEVAADSRRLQDMYRSINECPKTTIARIHGAAMAGGLGIAACCDASLAVGTTNFRVSEVRLGIVPGIIGPFLLARIGNSWLRHLAVTARMFDGEEALRIGLVHGVAEDEAALDALVAGHVILALEASPEAVAETKRLIAGIGGGPDPAVFDDALAWNVRTRRSSAASEGIGAFLERRKASWVPEG